MPDVDPDSLNKSQKERLEWVIEKLVDCLEETNEALKQNITIIEVHLDPLVIGTDLSSIITQQDTRTAANDTCIAELRSFLAE